MPIKPLTGFSPATHGAPRSLQEPVGPRATPGGFPGSLPHTQGAQGNALGVGARHSFPFM